MISLAFCLDALSEAWSRENRCKQSTEVSRVMETDTRVWKDKGSWNLRVNKGDRKKTSSNQHGGRAFG